MRFLIFISLSFFISSCGKLGSEQTDSRQVDQVTGFSGATTYFTDASSLKINVFYEPGAEPFTGNRPAGGKYWNLTKSNIESLMQYRSSAPTINVPTELSEMTALNSQGKSSWSGDDVYELFKQTTGHTETVPTGEFYIYFLNGNASEGNQVIGFNLNKTTIIAIFKSVIKASGGSTVQKFVEQSTIIHELGHAFGLVNAGLPMKNNHQDAANGAHTTNDECVMFWKNEGASDLQQFVARFITSGDTVMWGPEVLNDVEAQSR